jgi:membrane-associated protein
VEVLQFLIDLFLNLDTVLASWVDQYGPLVYGMLWLVVFCETGLVVTPFLPGDSLLFTAGALGGIGALDIRILAAVFLSAAIIGDTTNYFIGRLFGTRIIASGKGRALKPHYLGQTEAFFDRHGGKTIALARFFPIIRTFTPFMAGIGRMSLPRFWAFSIAGTLAWVGIFLGAGYFFGNIPVIQENLEFLVIGIIAVTLAPSAYHGIRHWLASRKQADEAEETA